MQQSRFAARTVSSRHEPSAKRSGQGVLHAYRSEFWEPGQSPAARGGTGNGRDRYSARTLRSSAGAADADATASDALGGQDPAGDSVMATSSLAHAPRAKLDRHVFPGLRRALQATMEARPENSLLFIANAIDSNSPGDPPPFECTPPSSPHIPAPMTQHCQL